MLVALNKIVAAEKYLSDYGDVEKKRMLAIWLAVGFFRYSYLICNKSL